MPTFWRSQADASAVVLRRHNFVSEQRVTAVNCRQVRADRSRLNGTAPQNFQEGSSTGTFYDLYFTASDVANEGRFVGTVPNKRQDKVSGTLAKKTLRTVVPVERATEDNVLSRCRRSGKNGDDTQSQWQSGYCKGKDAMKSHSER